MKRQEEDLLLLWVNIHEVLVNTMDAPLGPEKCL